jgi:DNA uptake protein ComE-like DNA-binding protein
MRKISFGALTAVALLAATPLMAQAPQTGGKAPETKMAPATTAPAAKTTSATTADLLDINTATPAQLEALKGVGKVRAEAIVKGRPFKAKDELVSKNLVPQNVYNDIKDKIIAKQKS